MTVLDSDAIRPSRPADPPSLWDAVVFSKLDEWQRAPLSADAEFDPPTQASLAAARAQATAMRDVGEPPPTRVGPDGSGGVAFETLDGQALIRRVEVSDTGQVDLYTFALDGRSVRHAAVGR